ncbi:hypothetical protein B1748_05260 [Paenibacillus sp. MY03]|jgi:AraC-like DNA-binding protein|uniref:helix-turn-helix domain-containing protein n=1 Tax=Paenibacillus sp. MY03 TaxID=302980 RepID=UPI000B3C3F45|nr:helix-turn-helix domain-containing protein [Paenibacillus sp. MY03]OUS78168.1 hypothetical protein B1748_05260 [Paenibacillus sp. MY03]
MFQHFGKIRNSIIFSWLVSYLSILLIPIVISGIVYDQSVRIMQNQVIRINESMIRQLQQAVEGQINNMEKISTQIALNPKLTRLINESANHRPMSFAYVEQIKQLFQDFNIYTLSNSFIDEFYVYIPNIDLVLTSSGHYASRSFYEANLHSRGATYESWHADMLRPHYNDYVVEPVLGSMEMETTITLIRSLPLQGESIKATLAVSINRDELLKLVENVNWANQDMFIITDRNNQVLFNSQNTSLPNFISNDKMMNASGVLYGELQGNEVAATYMKSGAGDWNYISITKTSLFNDRVAYIRKLTFVCLIMCVVIGGFIAYWFARKNYNPINQLIQNISRNAGLRLEKSQNEYRFLSEAFSNAISEKQRSDRRLEQQMSSLRFSFISRLLKGKAGNIVPTAESLKMYGISFDRPRYAVILFDIDDYSRLMVHASDEDNLRLAEFIVHNVAEEMTSAGLHRGFAVDIDNFVACLMNLEGTNDESLYCDMEEKVRDIQELLERKFQICLTAAISRVHPTAADISEAYQESLEAIEYKLLKGSGSMIRYDEIVTSIEVSGSYSYSLETERVLTNSIKSGDYEQAQRIMDHIFESNITNGRVSLQIVKCLMFDLVSTMIKTMNELSTVYDPSFIEELNPVERLLKCDTLSELRLQIHAILMKVCGVINEKSKGNNQTKLRDLMIEFIEDRYNDGNLNLTMVADHVGLSPKYVSAFFKQATGEGISAYINKVRLTKAKGLLSTPNLSISEIAGKVGYTNSNALIRAFNKIEGITPGQFRDLVQSETNQDPKY